MKLAGTGIGLVIAIAVSGGALANAVDPGAASSTERLNLPAWEPESPADGPVQLIISVPDQRVDVYEDGILIATSPVSTGKQGNETPTGVFSILQKRRHHRSNIYSRAPMPFMQRLTWSGIALHASNDVPDYPASHGCVRLPPDFAKKLFRYTSVGAHVVIADGTAGLTKISHPNLFQPAPAQKLTPVSIAVRTIAADGLEKVKTRNVDANTPPVRILIARRSGRERVRDVQRLLMGLGFNPGKLDGWMGRDTGGAIARFQESLGQQKTGAMSDELVDKLYGTAGLGPPPTWHIYVRQDFKPTFDAPLSVADSEAPLGTHLFAIMDIDRGTSEARWVAMTLNDGDAESVASAPDGSETTFARMPATAQEALDRIEIPASVRWRISEMLTPGSSLAITNSGISKETTPKGTDFVVLTR